MNKLILVVCFVVSFTCQAGNEQAGDIKRIEFTSAGILLVSHNGLRSNYPSCVGTSFVNRWALDATTEAGKVQASALLMVYMAGKKIVIRGSNNCNVWGDSETIRDFWTD